MTLDLNQVAAQIEGMVAQIKAGEMDREHRLRYALETLKAADLNSLKAKIERSRTTWLVAGLTDGLDHCHEPPPCPQEFTVLATDGSHIDVDRHSPVKCYLINIGSAILSYGQNPDAILTSQPTLCASREDLAIVNPQGSGEELIEGPLLGVKRTIEECQALARLAGGAMFKKPALGLLDGSLILWGLAGQAYHDYVRDVLLDRGFVKMLDKIKASGLPLASYISFPRSTDVANVLRVAICPHESPDCDHYCPGVARKCDTLAGILDRELFERLLAPGERSSTFISRSSVVRKHYREHEIQFFYLRADDEIARVEFPRWVAENRDLLNQVHALVLDQCHRGQGYPVALTEAHEKAVLSGADREQFWNLVELALAENHLPATTSAKSRSKRTRWI